MIWRLITLEDCESSSRLGVAFWASKSHCGLPGERSLWRFRSLPWRLTRVIGRGLCVLSSRGIRWGLCVLRFKYLAAPTRRTTETAVGTGLPNHCLHQAYWFYFLNSFISSLLCCVLVISVFEDFDWRLSQFPRFNFLSLFVFILCYPVFTLSVLCACLHFIMMTMLVFCYAYFWVLIPLQVVLR